MAKHEYYHYDPSLAAAVVFAILFMISAVWHTFQLIKARTWYFIPFVVGCIAEGIGYIGRIINANQTPDWTLGPYIMQALLLLLGPAFFAASIYMILGRLIQLVEAEKYSLIKTRWLTKFFLLGDIISIAAQGIGGGKLANATSQSDKDLGQTIIIVGLGFQIVFFSLFVVVAFVFNYRINKGPTEASLNISVPWRRLLHTLYVSSVLILIRSIFRVVEYITGSDGELQSKEIYTYLLDSLLMSITAFIFNIFHPSKIISVTPKKLPRGSDSEMQLGTYASIPRT